jgi:hypothetical protein
MPAPSVAFSGDETPSLPTIVAPAGLPFLQTGGGAGGPLPSDTVTPPKSAIYQGGKGGGAESGGEFDRGTGGFGNG